MKLKNAIFQYFFFQTLTVVLDRFLGLIRAIVDNRFTALLGSRLCLSAFFLFHYLVHLF